MLTLTDTAAEAIRGLTSGSGMPDGAGLRISPQPAGDGMGLELSLSTGPDTGDEVIEAQSARVYLQPEVAIALDDKLLDAEMDARGAVGFRLSPQAAS